MTADYSAPSSWGLRTEVGQDRRTKRRMGWRWDRKRRRRTAMKTTTTTTTTRQMLTVKENTIAAGLL